MSDNMHFCVKNCQIRQFAYYEILLLAISDATM